MSRLPPLNSPLLLGFDEIERVLARVGKGGGEGYPPYNIERLPQLSEPPDGPHGSAAGGEKLRITLAVAGFSKDQLDISVEDRQLTIRGRQVDDDSRTYLHQGIAARQFLRTFVLADAIVVKGAELKNGLLCIDLERPVPERIIQKINITQAD